MAIAPPSQNARNEQAKLLGTFLNNVGVACIVAGVIGPAVAYGYNLAQQPGGRLWWVVALAWLVNGIGLHVAARSVVRNIP